jgi:hypothetical protein
MTRVFLVQHGGQAGLWSRMNNTCFLMPTYFENTAEARAVCIKFELDRESLYPYVNM